MIDNFHKLQPYSLEKTEKAQLLLGELKYTVQNALNMLIILMQLDMILTGRRH